MSRIGHRAVAPTALGTVVTSWDLEPSVRFDQHEHPTHQLSIAGRSGVAMVVGERTYVVPGRGPCGSRPARPTASSRSAPPR